MRRDYTHYRQDRLDVEQEWRNKHREKYQKLYEGCWMFEGKYYGDQFKQEKLDEGKEIIMELEKLLEEFKPIKCGEAVLIKRMLPKLKCLVRYELYDEEVWQEGRDIIGFDL